MAVASAKKFLRTMAQPFGGREQEGISTWSIRDLEKHKEKMENEKIRELRSGHMGDMGDMGVDGAEAMDGVNGQDEFGDDIDDQAMLDLDALES